MTGRWAWIEDTGTGIPGVPEYVISAVEDVVHEKLPGVDNYDAERIARELAARGLLVRVMPL